MKSISIKFWLHDYKNKEKEKEINHLAGQEELCGKPIKYLQGRKKVILGTTGP